MLKHSRRRPVASFASSGVVLAPPGALRLSTSAAWPALPAALLAEAACEDSGACMGSPGPAHDLTAPWRPGKLTAVCVQGCKQVKAADCCSSHTWFVAFAVLLL